VNVITRETLRQCKRRIQRRLREIHWAEQPRPMFAARNIRYEVAERARGVACGGIGAMHLVALRTGLVEAIDRNLRVLKRHLPYHESDHVLNIAYNILAGGTCLEDIEHQRQAEAYLDALGAQRIPDPTTEGDFCRRFTPADIEGLLDAINEVRLGVWREQPAAFFDEAVIDADGTLATTFGECKEGMDISYKGQWGYHPLVVSLANTGEPLYLVNRSGNRPSHEGAAERFDQGIALCRRAGFRRVLLRGDTDFTQTGELDRWDADDVGFIFGIDARANLVGLAEGLLKSAWKPLVRPPKYEVRTRERERPENVKERIVKEREFENLRLCSEEVAEFAYRPTKCRQTLRVVALKKHLAVEKGQTRLFDDCRYFFYITNDRRSAPQAIVRGANGRCNQENLIEQLKNGARAMEMPVGDLVSNGAYLVMASLAWTLKAWFALLLPEAGRWQEKHRSEKQAVLKMEFKKFLGAFLRLPCQIVRTGRRIVYRLLGWNPWQEVLWRGVQALRDLPGRGHRRPLRC